MNINITIPHKSFITIRVALKMNIIGQWKDRRKMQKIGVLCANRWFNNDIREAIEAYRSMSDWNIVH